MDNLQLIEALDEAIRIISSAQINLAAGSTTIWRLADHACKHLDNQIKAILAAPAESIPAPAPDDDGACESCGGRQEHSAECDYSPESIVRDYEAING